MLTELHYAAWHVSRGHGVTAYEESNWADFRVTLPGLVFGGVSECKRIDAAAGDRRIAKEITEANRQIKAVPGSHYGVAVLDVRDRVPHQQGLIDAVPEAVLLMREQVTQAIRKHNSSVNVVILVWDDFVVGGAPPGENRPTGVVYRRRSVLIPHAAPKTAHSVPSDLLAFGHTVAYRLLWDR